MMTINRGYPIFPTRPSEISVRFVKILWRWAAEKRGDLKQFEYGPRKLPSWSVWVWLRCASGSSTILLCSVKHENQLDNPVEAFIAHWQDQQGGQERANYALFLNELADLLGQKHGIQLPPPQKPMIMSSSGSQKLSLRRGSLMPV